MTRGAHEPVPDRAETVVAVAVFVACLAFNIWAARVGWRSLNMPGHEFRQAQTALSAYYIQHDRDYSLAYPTPVLGKPWAIPLEFPLYQWTVVTVSDVTGLGLIKSARAVSLACFYLMLPALFLLLGDLHVPPGRRWYGLSLVATSPIYLFYARAFLIETMALMLALWFAVAFARAVLRRQWGWLVMANLAGAAAGMVKVTTLFVYLLPLGAWAGTRLWAGRRDRAWRRDFGWMAMAAAVPLVATVWWERFGAERRQLNPLADFLTAENLRTFTFGTWTDRLSPALWAQKWHSVVHGVTCWPALVIVAALALRFRTRLAASLAGAGLFLATLVIFPVLYGFHDYYFVANGVLLLAALGLVLVGLAESTRAGWAAGILALGLAGGQVYEYFNNYYAMQSGVGRGGNGLTQTLKDFVKEDEVVIAAGLDWNAMIPFYAQRRTMMIREVEERYPAQLDAAFALMAGEKVGALAIAGSVQNPAEFLKRATALGIEGQPIYQWRDVKIYLRKGNRDATVKKIMAMHYVDVRLVPGVEPRPERLAGVWLEVASLSEEQQIYFAGMKPQPVRFFSSFGPAIELADGRLDFGAHPVTRLIFALPAGEHRLRTKVLLPPDTYEGSQLPDRMTDGVEITLAALAPDRQGQLFLDRVLNPRDNAADRGWCPLEVSFRLERAGEVELMFGPGPAGRDTHDSISMSRLEIQ